MDWTKSDIGRNILLVSSKREYSWVGISQLSNRPSPFIWPRQRLRNLSGRRRHTSWDNTWRPINVTRTSRSRYIISSSQVSRIQSNKLWGIVREYPINNRRIEGQDGSNNLDIVEHHLGIRNHVQVIEGDLKSSTINTKTTSIPDSIISQGIEQRWLRVNTKASEPFRISSTSRQFHNFYFNNSANQNQDIVSRQKSSALQTDIRIHQHYTQTTLQTELR